MKEQERQATMFAIAHNTVNTFSFMLQNDPPNNIEGTPQSTRKSARKIATRNNKVTTNDSEESGTYVIWATPKHIQYIKSLCLKLFL